MARARMFAPLKGLLWIAVLAFAIGFGGYMAAGGGRTVLAAQRAAPAPPHWALTVEDATTADRI